MILGGLELFLRLITSRAIYFVETNPHLIDANGWFRLTPSFKGWWYGMRYEINSNGFRMTNEVAAKKSDLRILALGDSITEGIGVIRNSDLWPMKLQEMIQGETGASVEVINTGVQGWNLMQYDSKGRLGSAQFEPFMKTEGRALHADLVVYCICMNDVPSVVDDTFVETNEQNKKRFRIFPESCREFFKRKAIYRLARDLYREKSFSHLDFSKVPINNQDPAFWGHVSHEIKSLNETVQSSGARLFCVIVPYSYQILSKNLKLMEVNRQWAKCLRDNEIPYLDISRCMNEHTVLSYFALGDYIHLNRAGHALIAREVWALIQGHPSAEFTHFQEDSGKRNPISHPNTTSEDSLNFLKN